MWLPWLLPAQLSRLLVLARLTPCCNGYWQTSWTQLPRERDQGGLEDDPTTAYVDLFDNIGLGLTGVRLFVLPAAAVLLSRLGLTGRRRNR